MMNRKTIAVAGIAAMGSLGVLAGLSSTASALNCATPEFPAGGSLSLLPVNSRISIGCAASGESAAGESLATTNSVRVRLIAGTEASTAGYNSARQLIGGCLATDTTTGAGSVLDSSGCTGVTFKDIFVLD